MKNNKGFGKSEILTVMCLLLIIFAGGGYFILKGANKQKIATMKDNALNFSKNVVTNTASFRNTNVVYLEEANDGDYFPKVKNPFGAGYCDATQSRVNIKDGQSYATLLCGNYLIDESIFKANVEVPIYKVSDWQETKPEGDNVEEKVLYNCLDGGKEMYDTYYEDYYLVYKIYKDTGNEYYNVKSISKSVCVVTEKTFYRTKEAIEQK